MQGPEQMLGPCINQQGYPVNEESAAHREHVCFGADKADAAILAIHQHLPSETLTKQVLQDRRLLYDRVPNI